MSAFNCVHLSLQLCACEHAFVYMWTMSMQLCACEQWACSCVHVVVSMCACTMVAFTSLSNEHAVVWFWVCSFVHVSLQFYSCEHLVVSIWTLLCACKHAIACMWAWLVCMWAPWACEHAVVFLLGFLERFPNQSSLPGFASTLSNVKESLPS